MRVLIIGYSSIVRKRILPAFEKIAAIECIELASRSFAPSHPGLSSRVGTVYTDYADALAVSNADLVYVSLVNSQHAHWAEKALAQGRNVIVDKPACTSLAAAQQLVDLARGKNLLLAEATVYGCHPQIDLARDIFSQAQTYPTRLTVAFSFPPFAESNFRYHDRLGGGALLDLGPYAITPGRIFFGSNPDEILCRIGSRHPITGVETSFSMLAIYPGGRTMVGHFDFNTEYRNCINILGPGMSVDIDRVFTTPPDLESTIAFRSGNSTHNVTAPSADCFEIFLQHAIDAIKNHTQGIFAETLLRDALSLEHLRKAAQENGRK